MMPRTLLMRCDAVRRACLARGPWRSATTSFMRWKVRLISRSGTNSTSTRPVRAPGSTGLLDDEGGLGDLLRAAFDLYALEDDPEDALDVASKGEPEQRIPRCTRRLTFIHRDENDRERHVCYRALQHQNAIAFQARLRAALTASGISTRIPDRSC